ncbi:MupA/Atu3671 family FMN-dependent luciferase-like monooxygenase [Actinoplanes sp. NPDC049265]|uniref:MupA/Atu3671 family FMN-dependent luciferase-like monooxygenase n=1 Tax=Actinoplanes sp. NPDC049265 TaxID=3363902 RepID=UPI00371C85D4
MTTTSEDDVRQLSPSRRQLLDHLLRKQRNRDRAPMAVSLFFFSSDPDDRPGQKYELLLECAERADRAGLHAVWVPERHFDVFGAPYPSPATLLAAVAARTSRIQLRAGSVVLPLHDPLLVAEEWGVLDAISRQRMGMSLASGWHADDFVLAPDAYEGRKDILLDGLDTMRALWRGEAVTRTGPAGRELEVHAYPRPETPPEIWLTSSGNPATWEAAGRHDLHVLTALLEQTVDELTVKVNQYRRALASSGHSPDGKQITCMLHTCLASEADVVADRVREPLIRYLSQHLRLFEKFAASNDVGVRPESVSETDRAILLEHGLRRYMTSAGLFGSAETCRPMIDRLADAGVTEVGCLIDFGLPADQVLESVTELGRLQAAVRS